MSDQIREEAAAPQLPPPPQTRNTVVDQALAELADLPSDDLARHHERLSAAQDVLTGVLESSRGAVQTPIPGVLRPGPPAPRG